MVCFRVKVWYNRISICRTVKFIIFTERMETMYFHASQTADIEYLEPRISNHGIPLLYFSAKRENTLVYLSNAIEKYCRETGYVHHGKWTKWGSYGFTKEGILRLEEYWSNAPNIFRMRMTALWKLSKRARSSYRNMKIYRKHPCNGFTKP